MTHVSRVVAAGVAIAFTAGCATGRTSGYGMSVASDPFVDSSAKSSDGSSGNSSNSSGQSSGASSDSTKSSDATANSSKQGGSSDLNASSKNSSADSSRNSGQSWGIVSGVGLLVTTVAGLGVAIYATVRIVQQQQAQTALRFLRANGDQLKQDLALGAGPALQDLASAAEIRTDHAERFYALLRSHRRELLELSDPDHLTAERALTFLNRIGQLADADDVLKDDAAAFRARHANEG